MSHTTFSVSAALPVFRYGKTVWRNAAFRLAEPPAADAESDNPAANDYDSPWKDALEQFFEPAMALLMPALHARVDWSKPVEFLDKEFQALSHHLPAGRQVVDKLARVSGLDGSLMFILVHIEVQGGAARLSLLRRMAERMAFYAFRIRDGFRPDSANGNLALFSMAVLTNSHRGPPVLTRAWEFLGCASTFQCPVVHLGQWWERWGELETLARTNPFAVVVMAQLLAHRHKGGDRLVPKTWLVRLLYEYNYSRDAILSVLRLIDWMLTLPSALAPDFEQATRAIEQEYTMSFVMSFERNAEARGKAEGKAEGMLSILQYQLSRKFGALPDWVDTRLKQADTDTLVLWSDRILFADTLEEVFEVRN